MAENSESTPVQASLTIPVARPTLGELTAFDGKLSTKYKSRLISLPSDNGQDHHKKLKLSKHMEAEIKISLHSAILGSRYDRNQ